MIDSRTKPPPLVLFPKTTQRIVREPFARIDNGRRKGSDGDTISSYEFLLTTLVRIPRDGDQHSELMSITIPK